MFKIETHGEEEAASRRSFTPEFNAELVALCRRGDRSVGHVASGLRSDRATCAPGVKYAEIGQGERRGPTTEEGAELARLHWEHCSLREDVEVLERVSAFLALCNHLLAQVGWLVSSLPDSDRGCSLLGRSTSIQLQPLLLRSLRNATFKKTDAPRIR
jgi:transposase